MAAAEIANAIREGTFPDSDDTLSATLTGSSISELFNTISANKNDLDQELRALSQDSAGNVDEWIAQAKKVQHDIQQCKLEARKIVEEHAGVKSKQSQAIEAANKADLLQKEIAFTQILQAGLHEITEVNEHLLGIERLISEENPPSAATELKLSEERISSVKGSQVRALLLDFHTDLKRRTQKQLEIGLHAIVTSARKEDQAILRITLPAGHDSLTHITQGLDALGALEYATKPITEDIQAFAIGALQTNSRLKLASHSKTGDGLEASYADQESNVPEAIAFVEDVIAYLHDGLPRELLELIAGSVIPKLISTLITDWLNPSIPVNLDRLDEFDAMRSQVTALAQTIDSYGWHAAVQLAQWLEQAPRTWLSKRKGETLDAVRRVFRTAKGATHQVERVERQKASVLNTSAGPKDTSDDWDASWDDEPQTAKPSSSNDEEDTGGWGFDDDDDADENHTAQNQSKNNTKPETEDAADAWGWDDEDDQKSTKPSNSKPNGKPDTGNESQELTLTELYTITDIPDHLVEAIGRDIQDATSLQQNPHPSLSDIPAASGLLALPTLALAMFRATATTHYSNTLNLGNMHLYNDSIYIADKLQNLAAPSALLQTIPSDTSAVLKFARSAYAREMDIQRTILNDLLDGAQGFSNCTQFPYSQEIDNAMLSTVDRIRTVHAEWKPILSTSALLQSIGALLNATITKFLADILDLEDISEAQSHRLAAFAAQFTALEDLFTASSSEAQEGEDGRQDPIPLTAVYVSNWLKLQYLAQILESSLVDIEYLWTEGELSLEFSAEELVDLVKALFADSARRRAAIAGVKGR